MAKAPIKPLTLHEWIEETGPRQVSYLLKVDVRSVFHWRRGVCLPRPEQMALIRKYSHGAVSCDVMVSAYLLKRRSLPSKISGRKN